VERTQYAKRQDEHHTEGDETTGINNNGTERNKMERPRTFQLEWI